MQEDTFKIKGNPESFDDESSNHFEDKGISDKDKDKEETEKKPRRKRRTRKEKKQDEYIKIGINLPKTLVKQMKIEAVKDDETISAWLEKLLRRSIGKRVKKKVEDPIST